jgi:hypothetical protein
MLARDLLLVAGVALAGLGLLLILAALVAPGVGTAVWRWGHTTVVFPIGLCIVLSLVLTVVLNLLLRGR